MEEHPDLAPIALPLIGRVSCGGGRANEPVASPDALGKSEHPP
jgi:hypothetical protein